MAYAAGAPPSSERLAELARTFRLVVVDEELAGVPAPAVVSDNERGGRLAGEHLRALGHRAVLMITGPPALASVPLRSRGFLSAFGGDGVRVERVAGDYRAESAAAAVRAALTEGPPWFTAVFAANDVMALAAIEALVDHGVRVPEDVSVVGYDDTVFAALVRPGLTTVRQPVYEMGWVAADRLARSLSGGGDGDAEEASKVVLDVELVIRQTTAPPRDVEVTQ
jgi:LacI family transcriptional regulator